MELVVGYPEFSKKNAVNKKYYNHDDLWQKRAHTKNPFYGSYSSHLYSYLLDQLKAVLPRPLRGMRVLDVGCGTGLLGLKIIEEGMEYCGIDESSVAIEIGSRHNPQLIISMFDFAQAGQLPETWQNAFDLVTCINTLHCLVEKKDRIAMLMNVRAAMDHQGYLLMTTMCGPYMPLRSFGKPPRYYGAVEEIVSELQQVGLSHIVWQKIERSSHPAKIPNYYILIKA